MDHHPAFSRFPPRIRRATFRGPGLGARLAFLPHSTDLMNERRYSRDEASAIFERAAQVEEHGVGSGAPGEGMTLQQLQEIGREVGLSPDALARAAATLDRVGRPTGRRILGFPIQVGLTVTLGRQMGDEEWERLVVDLRTIFDARGAVRRDGGLRQWTNGNLQVLLEPAEGGHRIRMRTTNGLAGSLAAMGVALIAAGGATILSLLTGGELADPASLLGVGVMAVMGSGLLAAAALRLPGWAAIRRKQMEEIARRLVANGEA